MKLTEITAATNDFGSIQLQIYFANNGETYGASQCFELGDPAHLAILKLRHLVKIIENMSKGAEEAATPLANEAERPNSEPPDTFNVHAIAGYLIDSKLNKIEHGVILNPSLILGNSWPNGLYVIQLVSCRSGNHRTWTLRKVAPVRQETAQIEPGVTVGMADRLRAVLDSEGVPRFENVSSENVRLRDALKGVIESNSLKYTCAVCGTTKISVSPGRLTTCKCGNDTFVKA